MGARPGKTVIDITFFMGIIDSCCHPHTPRIQSLSLMSLNSRLMSPLPSALSVTSPCSMFTPPCLTGLTVREKLLSLKHYLPVVPGFLWFMGQRSWAPGGPQGPCLYPHLPFCPFTPAFQLSLDTHPTYLRALDYAGLCLVTLVLSRAAPGSFLISLKPAWSRFPCYQLSCPPNQIFSFTDSNMATWLFHFCSHDYGANPWYSCDK